MGAVWFTVTVKVIAIDWAGVATARGQRDRIWAATVEQGRLTDLSNGRTRAEVVEFVISESAAVDGLVVGLDFAFSFPSSFPRQHGLEDVVDLWDLVAREGEDWLSLCQPPFWGRPGTTRPDLPGHLRVTDSSCRPVAGITPKSVFQIGGAGAVGTGSIRGMPYLRTLRDAGFSIWPFDPPGWPAVIEIYPRALTGPVTKSDRTSRAAYLDRWDLPELLRRRAEDSEDAFDAAISALVMSRHSQELADLQAATDPDVRLEGSIWVPSAGSGPATPLPAPEDRLPPPLSDLQREISAILSDVRTIEARLERVRRSAEALSQGGPSPELGTAETV